jgi:hypothetical protein
MEEVSEARDQVAVIAFTAALVAACPSSNDLRQFEF